MNRINRWSCLVATSTFYLLALHSARDNPRTSGATHGCHGGAHFIAPQLLDMYNKETATVVGISNLPFTNTFGTLWELSVRMETLSAA